MHLAGQGNGRDLIPRGTRIRKDFPDRGLGGPSPVRRILLSPSGFRRSKRLVLDRSGMNNPALFIYKYGAAAPSSYINS